LSVREKIAGVEFIGANGPHAPAAALGIRDGAHCRQTAAT